MTPDLLWLVLALVAAGALAGVLAGLLGIGGGLVFVPTLVFLFKVQGLPDHLVMHMAVGTSLAAIVLTSLSSIRAHARLGSIDWLVFRHLLPGLLAGGLLGAACASLLSGFGLRVFFAAFLMLVAMQMWMGGRGAMARTTHGPLGTGIAGGAIGTLSALLGIGGGTLTVPYLTWSGLAVLRAVGTAAAAGLPLALAGSAGFVFIGIGVDGRPHTSSGFVWWPAAVLIGSVAMVLAPTGARLAHRIEPNKLRRVFALVLVVVAFSLVR